MDALRHREGGGQDGRLPPPSPVARALAALRARLAGARGPSQRAIGPRAGLVALLLLVLVVVIAVVALAFDGDDEADRGSGAATVPELSESLRSDRLGATVRYPEGWRKQRKSRAVVVRRGDRSALVSIAAPAPASETPGVLRTAVDEIESSYRRVTDVARERSEISGYPGVVRTMSATNEEGTPLRVLVASVEGKGRAYLVSAFAAEDSGERLVELERIVSSLRLRK